MQRRFSYLIILLTLLFNIFATTAAAGDVSLEKDMQRTLLRSKAIIKAIQAKLDTQSSISADLARLQTIAEEIRATHMLLDARFTRREERVRSLGSKAVERHAEITGKYRLVTEEYLTRLESLKTEQDVSPDILDDILNTLNTIIPEKKRPIFGTLPYRHLNLTSKKPLLEPTITPAYKGGTPDVTEADTQSTPEASITKEIAELAESLDWNPVSIYEWVKNNIETQWYYGAMKGAAETLRQKSGNDTDQAALLVALLRSSDFPARYVRGVAEIFPDIERAKALIGVGDENELAEFFRKAGIPFTPVIGAGKIANLQFEHIWVETLVPYANYRGAVIDEHGQTWLALDTSIKVAGYTVNDTEHLPDGFDLAAIRDEYLSGIVEDTPLEYLRNSLNAYLEDAGAGYSYDDLLQDKTLVPEQMNILPAGLQFKEVAITAEYNALPEELIHKARFFATDKNYISLFDVTLPLYQLSNQMITVTYEPETVEDQEIINSYGGLDNTPAYLVRLRPTLRVSRERQAVGQDGLPMGEDFRLAVQLISPNSSQRVENTFTVGNLSVIGLVAQDAVLPEAVGEEKQDAEWLLHDAAIDYIDRLNQAEAELASLLKLNIARPVASLVTLGGVIDVTYLLNSPHGFEWKGLFVDADLRAVEIAGGAESSGEISAQKIFMQISSLEGSVLEARVLEDNFGVNSISTARLLGIAVNQGIPILTLDTENVDTMLPALPFDDNIKEDIVDSVNQDLQIIIPQSEIFFEDWIGAGYIKENPQTGEAGYMLSGMIAGGMTVWSADRWPDYYYSRMANPYSEPPNQDPQSAYYIQKITRTDLQKGTAGEPLADNLQVIVYDEQNRPVQGTEVIFTIKAGGGRFSTGTVKLATVTGYNGIAGARFVVGTRTADNPTMWRRDGDTYSQQVGENIVDAALASGTAIKTPFTAYGLPGEPAQIDKIYGDDIFSSILAWQGFLKVVVRDQYGNPISNQKVIFSTQPAVERSSCNSAHQDTRPALLIAHDDACIANMPVYGQCASAAISQEVVTRPDGALVYFMAGGTPDADYPITAVSGQLSATFTRHTFAFGNCGGTTRPAHEFILQTIFASDDYGNNINAASPGSTIPLNARIYFLSEDELEQSVTISCDNDQNGEYEPVTCTRIVGARTYSVNTAFQSASVNFAGQPGTAAEDGVYLGQYEVQPGINDILIGGSATIGIHRSSVGCAGCSIVDDTVTRAGYSYLRVYGVEITIDTSESGVPDTVMVPVDDEGYTRCDTRINYTIAPPEYQANTAYVVIYKDNEPINYIPAETKEQGFAMIARGYRFDPDLSYEAEVVLNMGSGAEVRSERKALKPGDVRIKEIYLEDYRDNVLQGETAVARVTTVPADRPVVWKIVSISKPGVKAQIDPSKGIIFVERESIGGYIIVRATDVEIDCVYKEEKIYIGCQACQSPSGLCQVAGNCSLFLNSIDARFSLGSAKRGQSAGEIYLKSDHPSSILATPRALVLTTLARDVEALYDENDMLRQVLAPESFVDIVVTGPFSYDMNFYHSDAISGQADGIYEVSPGSEPLVIWRVENADSSETVYNRLKISEIRNSASKVNEYIWDEEQSTWSLARGNGLEIQTRKEILEPEISSKTVVHTITDSANNIASIEETTYQQFAWGEEIVRTTVDPEGADLTTITAYYEDPDVEGSYGKIKSQVNSDGSWVRYEYDELGRKILEVRAWLDAPLDAPADSARAVYYDYSVVDPSDSQASKDSHSPRTVTEKILGTTVARTYYSYRVEASGERIETVERCVDANGGWSDSGNQRTVTIYYPSGTGLADSGAIKSLLSPDGRLQSYTYESGTYKTNADPTQPGFFTTGAGSARRTTVVSGTSDSPAGIAYKTTREIIIQDELGRQPLQIVEVYDGSAYHPIQWNVQLYDDMGRMTVNHQSNGTFTESTWGCCVKDSETDAQGIERTYSYDDLQRLVTETKQGIAGGTWPAQSDIQTSYTYDAAGRQLSQTISAGGMGLVSSNVYDGAGRLRSTTDAAGLVTSYDYDPNGLVSTVTRPGGATEVTTRFQDGHTRSVTGTGVVPRYYEYGVNADGSQWTKVLISGPASPRWEKTTVDLLGRTIRIEKPGYISIETTENFYNAKGQLARTIASGLADTIYEYDELGNQIRNGLDVDRSGALETASNDRITESETLFASISNSWWQETRQRVYAEENVSSATTTGINRTRLTGWSAGKTSETLNIDIHGNQTSSWAVIDRANKTTTRTVDFPDSDINAVSITANGLLMSSRSKTNVASNFSYDALGRRTGFTDPRTGTAITHYNDKNQVDYVEDAAGNRTQFAYYPDTGFKFSETNALNKNTYFIYNARGQVTHTWGDVPYPVKYEYDEYAQLKRMHTYRGAISWNLAMWPEGDTGTADVTTWHYHVATGLLEAKEDAEGRSVSYTYGVAGRLAARTWARTENGNPLMTNYAYDPDTAELKTIDYSDSTPDVGFTYDRLGRQKTVTDAVGTRTFAYNTALQPESETITGLYDHVITRTYQTSEVIGRSTGFNAGADYSIIYRYDETGRFNSVAWNVAGASDTAIYAFAENSDLLQQLTTDNGLRTTYQYQIKRHLRTRVKNEYNANLISQYDYQYDALGRRKSVVNSGQAFAANAFNRLGYDDRNQLTNSTRYLGSDVNDLSNPVEPEQRIYDYDPIGNRRQAIGWDNLTNSTQTEAYNTNALNQYEQITKDNSQPTTNNLTYDFDGNLTFVTSTDATKLYKYNAENRLIAVEPQIPVDGDDKVEFIYDYMGRRVQKTLYTRSSGVWLQVSGKLFVYDGWNVIIESTDNGQTTTNKYFVWGLDLSQSLQGAGGIGGLITAVDSSLTHYFCYDGNGNVGQLVDASDGSVAAYYEYDPYGNEIVAHGSEAGNNPYRFSTKYFDSEIELYYYGYRYYSSDLGRWLTRDPVAEDGGLNLYTIVENNTVNLVDELGMWKFKHGKRIGGSRSTVVADKNQDPYRLLANLVKLNLGEIKEWLKKWKENKKVCENDEFTVPNTFIIGEGRTAFISYGLFNMWENRLAKALYERGFYVKVIQQDVGQSKSDVLNALTDDDTWGYAFFGHGVKVLFDFTNESDLNGVFEWTKDEYIHPDDITQKFKFGLGINYHCYAGKRQWYRLSRRYFGTWGLSFSFLGPSAFGWIGTWDSLVGSATD